MQIYEFFFEAEPRLLKVWLLVQENYSNDSNYLSIQWIPTDRKRDLLKISSNTYLLDMNLEKICWPEIPVWHNYYYQ